MCQSYAEPSPERFGTPLAGLPGLSPALRRILSDYAGIFTAEVLADASPRHMASLPGVGRARLRAILVAQREFRRQQVRLLTRQHVDEALLPENPRSLIAGVTIPLSAVLARREDLREVLDSGRRSETPADPILLRVRPDLPGRYELCDGHHRVAQALRAGEWRIAATIDPIPDDEPLEEPFYDFAAAARGSVASTCQRASKFTEREGQ